MGYLNVKIVVYVPTKDADSLRQAIGNTGAGIVGNYTHCSFSSKGTGRFFPKEGANPTIGKVGKLESVEEERIEFVCPKDKMNEVIQTIKNNHPYEEVALDVYPLKDRLPLNEALVVQLIREAKGLIILIENNFASQRKVLGYLIESLFFALRQMGYFFTEKKSPLFYYGSTLSQTEKNILETIKNIRDSIGHRESSDNFFNASIKVVGGMNFKNDDVVIQYGRNQLYLIKDIIAIHKKLRHLFSSATELAFLTKSYGWQMDEAELQKAENGLAEKLKDPESLLKGYWTKTHPGDVNVD